MPKRLIKIANSIWIDEENTLYKRQSSTQLVASDGKVWQLPRLGEQIWLDGTGNGLMLSH